MILPVKKKKRLNLQWTKSSAHNDENPDLIPARPGFLKSDLAGSS